LNRKRLLRKLASGSFNNVSFGDMLDLMKGLGFEESRTSGSHHILSHPKIDALVNLQEVRGEAKPYQIRQVMRIVERYNLKIEEQ
jgi:predicted RNA binding protein YcfA (HicA-like mRNA interferase family)